MQSVNRLRGLQVSLGGIRQEVAIAGAGISGAYLYRLLRSKGFHVDIFDIENGTKCGLSPCAWGTSRGFTDLVEASGLDPEAYILRRHDHVMMDGTRIRGDLMTFDKPKLVKDLLMGADVRHTSVCVSEYDRVIDATGVSRALLPFINEDLILNCTQYRIQWNENLENAIKLGKIGYAWCFPLGDEVYHIGCGSYLADPKVLLKNIGWLGNHPSDLTRKTLCECDGNIRLTSPYYSQPFIADGTTDGVWGIGEAIGCVAPLVGDGVVPGMRSAQILMENWKNPEDYKNAILNEFKWMKKEREIIDKLVGAKHLGIEDARVVKKNSKRMGIRIGLNRAATLMKHLR
jgi:flavin-dependent dehydrogenase